MHEWADGDPTTVQHDGQMRRVGLHQRTHRGRIDHVGGDEDGDGIHRRFMHQVHPGLAETARDLVGGRDHRRTECAHGDGWRRGRCRLLQGRREGRDERPRAVDGAAERRRHGVECRVGQAALEFLDHPLLPLVGMIEDRHLVGAELQAVGRPPERRMSGVEMQHPPIVRPPRPRRVTIHRRCPRGGENARLWRSR